MGLTSGNGGDDRLQVVTIVFALVISLTVSLMAPIMAPGYDTDTGYSYTDLYLEKSNLESYTGESMMNMTPWALTGVYTPWTVGDPINIDPETGWLYGESVNYSRAGFAGTTNLGDTKSIYLNPNYKSAMPLTQQTTTTQETPSTWVDPNGGGTYFDEFINWIGGLFGGSTEPPLEDVDVNYWDFTGYRYEFDPMLKIDWSNPSDPDYSTVSQSDAKLSIVWYKSEAGQGLSSGLILYRSSGQGLSYDLSLEDIIANYNTATGYSTKYALDFNGVSVYINIRFDQDVMAGSVDLTQAFDDGRWTMAITAKSMDNFMSLSSSNTLSSSAANILDTYINIYTLSMPEVPLTWSIVLWVLCILPIDLVILMFLSRFGIIGVGVGILGNVLLGVLGGA